MLASTIFAYRYDLSQAQTDMYIVAIAWLYVVFMMSVTEQSAVAGILTFFLYGVFPLTIVLYLMGTPQRKRNRQIREKAALDAKQAIVTGDAGTKPDSLPTDKS